MPIAFLAPVFLAGLAAVAIPVLIHLTNRPKEDVTPFPSLMFLEPTEYRDASRRRLRHLFLLALRVLALVLIAGAFARPFLDRPDAPPVTIDGGREVVVLLDRSASMAIGDRLDEGVSAAGEVADGLARGDRATLVVFDHEAAAVNRATDQPAVLRSALDTVRVSDGATRLAPALRLAESLLTGSPLPRRELVIVSDFQRRAWQGEGGLKMPAGTEIRTVAVGEPVATRGVVDVSFAREQFSGRERVRVSARIAAHDLAREVDVPVELILDGRSLQSRQVRLEAGGTAVASFDPVTLEDRPLEGEVRIPGDAFAADDVFRFTLSAGRSVRVLVLESRAADGRSSLYLTRALEVGGDHQVGVMPGTAFDAADLAGIDVVILNDVDALSAEAREALGSFAAVGGGVVTVLGGRSRAETLAGIVPGTIGGTLDRTADGGASLSRFEAEHPVFEPFRDPGGGGLAGARFYRYRALEPDPAGTVLARFDDGAPALVDAASGRGRLLVLTAPLDGRWSDLVLHPAFVPLAHGLVRHAGGREPAPAWRTVGELMATRGLLTSADGSGGGGGGGVDGGAADGEDESAMVLAPSGARIRPGDGRGLVRLEEAGFYQLRDPRAPAPPPGVAVNVDPREAGGEIVPPDEVVAAITPQAPAPSLASVAPEDRERRQALWWFFLAGAFVLMAAESVVGNGLSRRATPVTVMERRRA